MILKVNSQLRKKINIAVGIVIGVLVLICLALALIFKFVHIYDDIVTEPTCVSDGYVSHICKICCRTYIDDEIIPKTGHNFGEWNITSNATMLQVGVQERTCTVCGVAVEKSFSVIDYGMPTIIIDGDLKNIENIQTQNAFVSFSFIDGDYRLDCTGYIGRQKTSVQGTKKYNYSLTLYDNSNTLNRVSADLCGLGEASSFSLISNYLDYTMSRNILSAELYEDISATRGDELNPHIAKLSNNCCIDGHYVMLYVNGEYKGIYNLNTYKDDVSYGLKDYSMSAMMLSEFVADSTRFKVPVSNTYSDGWAVKYFRSYTNDYDNVISSMNRLIDFVMQNNGEEFREGIGQYLDVDSAIDYMLMMYFTGAQDNSINNIVWITYDGEQWICLPFDVHTSFGLSSNGTSLRDYSEMIPYTEYDEELGIRINSGTGMLLWDRLLNNFTDEVVARYKELRQEVFTAENVENILAGLKSEIKTEVYAVEIDIWPDIPSKLITSANQIMSYTNSRIPLLDDFFDGLENN